MKCLINLISINFLISLTKRRIGRLLSNNDKIMWGHDLHFLLTQNEIYLENDDTENAITIARDIIELCDDQDIKLITYYDEEYPIELRKIQDPPSCLYVKGDPTILNQKSIPIIGSRNIKEQTEYIGKKLGLWLSKEFIIVSGLALGSDTAAHFGSLYGGKSIAVLPGGINNIIPVSNKRLSERILEKGGCLISEISPTQVRVFNSFYVNRNRIISGISCGVIVLQSKIKSGTMHTVNFSHANKRKIFVVMPPSNDSPYDGNLEIIQNKGGISIPISIIEDENDTRSFFQKYLQVCHSTNY